MTTQNDSSVKDFISSLDEQTVKDSLVLIEMMQRISGHEPKLWNVGTIGFDTYHYKYDSGREGDGHVIGFYPRKSKITIYLMDGTARYAELLAKLGKHTTTGYCVYIKRLSDIELPVLEQIVQKSYSKSTMVVKSCQKVYISHMSKPAMDKRIAMPTLDQVNAFLNTTKDAREYKRAMAVKLLLLEFEPRDIAELLQVTESFVSKWKKLYSEHGVAVFVIKYHGYQGYLTSEQRQSITERIKTQHIATIDDLIAFIRTTYRIEFKSRQSYYDLFAEAGITWKRAQSQHPDKDLERIAIKKRD